MPKLVIAVDLGATKILYGIGNVAGELFYKNIIPTQAEMGAAYIIDTIAEVINHLIGAYAADKEVAGIVIATPGPLSYPDRAVRNSPNLKWENIALKTEIEARLNREVMVEKDTNIAVLGEYYFGQGKKYKELIYITVSTGIGAGIIINGQLYRGSRGGAGEIGHMVVAAGEIKCACGRTGCLEALASGRAIANKARSLGIIYPGEGVKEVGDKVRQGDELAARLLNETADYLAIGIANLINVFNPQAVILGGGVMQGLQDLWLDRIAKQVLSSAFPLNVGDLSIQVTSLGGDIGLYGCIAAVNIME